MMDNGATTTTVLDILSVAITALGRTWSASSSLSSSSGAVNVGIFTLNIEGEKTMRGVEGPDIIRLIMGAFFLKR